KLLPGKNFFASASVIGGYITFSLSPICVPRLPRSSAGTLVRVSILILPEPSASMVSSSFILKHPAQSRTRIGPRRKAAADIFRKRAFAFMLFLFKTGADSTRASHPLVDFDTQLPCLWASHALQRPEDFPQLIILLGLVHNAAQEWQIFGIA